MEFFVKLVFYGNDFGKIDLSIFVFEDVVWIIVLFFFLIV